MHACDKLNLIAITTLHFQNLLGPPKSLYPRVNTIATYVRVQICGVCCGRAFAEVNYLIIT